MHPQVLAFVATLVSYAVHGNRVDLQLDHGAAQILFLSDKSFHFRRALEGELPASRPELPPVIALQVLEMPGVVQLKTKFLEVVIDRHGVLLHVRRIDGVTIMSDVSEPKKDGDGITWDRQAPAGVRYYGLGRRAELTFDLRGKSVDAEIPFLISTAGYGEFHTGAGAYKFDFTAPNQYAIQAPQVDYYFFYGPAPKEIFRSRKDGPAIAVLPPLATTEGTWKTLRDDFLRLVHSAMSGETFPSIDLTPYDKAPAELQTRARQIFSLVPTVTPGAVGLSPFRKQTASFYEMYGVELRDRGFPVWHPLPFEFPDDPECALHADEFMLGDEMLIAPIYEPGTVRHVYLPPGSWTNLGTNEILAGKRTISLDSQALAVFAHNGSIIPLDSPGGMGLHYFPALPGEFFLHEKDPDDFTQLHAAPAGDVTRLEIASKKDRDYQWVVHNVERPKEVGFDDQKFPAAPELAKLADRMWFYDAQKNLHIRIKVKAGEQSIINLSW